MWEHFLVGKCDIWCYGVQMVLIEGPQLQITWKQIFEGKKRESNLLHLYTL